MKTCVFDIETDGLNPTKIHCLSASVYSQGEWRLKSTTDYEEMKKFFLSSDVLVGHNIALYDIPVVERLLNIKVEAKLIDTLFISWYLYPDKLKHGLADWGEYFGTPKPKVSDWEDLPIEVYVHRCESDVLNNCQVYDKMIKDLDKLYDSDQERIDRLVDYLIHKANCARLAESSGWKLNIDKATSSLAELEILKEEKVQQLKEAMPNIESYKTVVRPESLYKTPVTQKRPARFQKDDGSLTALGIKYKAVCDVIGVDAYVTESVTIQSKELTKKGMEWLELLEQFGLPETHVEPLEVLNSSQEPNPNSTSQIKEWLDSLGWEPETFKTGTNGEVPQVRVEINGEKFLCPSVKRLIEVEPAIEALDGITVLSHRIGLLKGFLDNVDGNGFLKASINGLTNTLRFKHKILVNLPSINKPFGDIIRGCLIAPEGEELCGSDMSSLEDRVKLHFMWEYDPEYVQTMLDPSYDPHLDIAVKAGFITQDEMEFFKWFKKNN